MRRILIINVLLLAIIAALVVQIFSLWWSAEAEVETVAPREAKAQRPEIQPAPHRPPAPDLANHIAEKDLFDASRSAEKAQVVTTAEAPPPPLNLALLGVTVAAGAREALFKDQSQPKPLWLREGEEFNGYKIARIDPTSVELTTPGGDHVTLVINVEKGAVRPGMPLPGPAGIQPTPPQPAVAARPGRPTPPVPGGVAATPNDIKEKIERLREEARKRRQRPQPQPQ